MMRALNDKNLPPLVLHVIQHLITGGLENGLVNLINRSPPGRFRHAIVCLDRISDFKNRINDKSIPVLVLNKQPGKDFKIFVKLWSVFRDLKPDIVHTRNISSLEALVVAALCELGAECMVNMDEKFTT